MKFIKIFSFSLFLFLIVFIFRNWFSLNLIAGGDFQIYYPEMLQDLSRFPSAWNWTLRMGFGANGASLLWNYVTVSLPIIIFGSVFHFDWPLIQRIGYLYPFLVLIVLAPYLFFKRIFSFPWVLLPISIFCFNTYILMLVGGGQIFLSLAYALIPLVFYCFYKLFRNEFASSRMRVRVISISTIVFSLQLLFDVRITYVTLVMVSIYILVAIGFSKISLRNLINFLPVFFVTVFLHAFWILPTIILRQNPLSALGSEFVSVGIINFLSFAKLENTVSLLQPNWSENIFGKTYFMKPEFLLLPILAFSSLFFVKGETKKNRELILVFTIIAIVCAFFAKGSNEPFGKIYSWMFSNFPGFIMFRDPTKWYGGIAFAYAFLIPFSVKKIYEQILILNIKSRILPKKILGLFSKAFLLIVVICLILLIRSAWLGNLKGNFRTTQIPPEYLRLKSFISQESEFSRTLWIPGSSKYSFYSSNHPLISGIGIIEKSNNENLVKNMSKDDSKRILQDSSVKYVIIPYDKDGEIFLSDRKYDEKKYLRTIADVERIPYLTEIDRFGSIKVFKVPGARGHFFSNNPNLSIFYSRVSSDEYMVNLKNASKGDVVVFSEGYDGNWIASNEDIGYSQQSLPYDKFLNSFVLPKGGNYSIKIYYNPQKLVRLGILISIITSLIVLFFIGYLCLNKIRLIRQ